MEVTTIGIDIAKRIFQIHGVDKNGKTIVAVANKLARVVFAVLSSGNDYTKSKVCT